MPTIYQSLLKKRKEETSKKETKQIKNKEIYIKKDNKEKTR